MILFFLHFGETQLLITFILFLLQKKKPVEVETTVIQGSGRDNGGNGNTRNRLTNLNSGNQNNTNNSNNQETGNQQQSRDVQEMNDIQVRVINDNVNTSGSGGGTTSGSRSNWRHNEATIEVAMASPDEENLPPEIEQPPLYIPPQVTTALVNETSMAINNSSSQAATDAEALCSSGNNGTNATNTAAGEELPQVKISNL